MDLQAGSRVGQYTLDSYLGGGSFGAVWRGHDDDGHDVAVKLLTGALSTGDAVRMRADVEMLAASAVASRSEHVVKVLGGGNDPLPYIVMEYVDGQDLASLLNEGGILPVRRTIEVGVAIMDALSALNATGIFHRDIKPANVMIDSKGVIKLADFGIAKIVGYDSITMTGQAAMTMAYAAPEIWDEDSPFGRPSHRSDLYAAGIVLYQCLTGMPPFRGNYGALYKAHAERQADYGLLPSSTPPSLRVLIERCMEKRQDDRPVDAEECLLILDRARVELDEFAGRPPEHEPMHFGPWRRESPHEVLPWAWRCRHETTNEPATVELHFAAALDEGSALRRAVGASPELSKHGAERLLGTNRMLLAPDQSWAGAPRQPFEFWVAREDTAPPNGRNISLAALKAGVVALAAMIAAGEAAKVPLAFKNELRMSSDGSVYVARPGLVIPKARVKADALAAIRSLPLAADAVDVAGEVQSFDELLRRSSNGQLPVTELAAGRKSPDAATVLAETPKPYVEPPLPVAAPRVPRVEPSPVAHRGVNMYLRPIGPAGGTYEYELVATNPNPRPVNLDLSFSSLHDQLLVRVVSRAVMDAGETKVFQVLVSARKKRWFGGKKMIPFLISGSTPDDWMLSHAFGNGGEPPPPVQSGVASGDYPDEPSQVAPLVLGGGVLGLAALGVFAALAMHIGGNDNKGAVLGTTPTPVATHTPRATRVPSATKQPVTATVVAAIPTATAPKATATTAPSTTTPVSATATSAPSTATPAASTPTPPSGGTAPKPGTYSVNKVLGTDSGVQLTLTTIAVGSDGKLTANFSYLNTGTVYSSAKLACQSSTPQSTISQAGGATLTSVDSFCDHNVGATFDVPKGGTHAEYTIFQSGNLDASKPISIAVGGWSTMDGIYLK